MDITTIAPMVISALSPFVSKGLEKLSEKTAEEGFNERKAIWETVKGLFKYDDLTLLNLLKEAETDVKAQGKLEGRLETHLGANPEIAKELKVLLKRIPPSQAKQNTMTMTGDGNFGFQDVSGSDIKINQK